MSEINTPRLMAAAKEFNIGTSTLTDFLVSKGFETSDLKPTSKISEDMYRILQIEFQPDKVAKQKAEQIDLPKNAPPDSKKRKDEQDLSVTKKETAKIKEEKPVPSGETVVSDKQEEATKEHKSDTLPEKEKTPEANVTEKENPAKPDRSVVPEQSDVIKIDAPAVEGVKIVDKIDLSTIDSSVRPKKDAKKKEVKKKVKGVIEKESVPELPKEEAKGPVVNIEKDVPAIITNIKAAKLEGPKIMGTIELPANNDTRPKPNDERRKRKRIVVEKKRPSGDHQPRPNVQRPQGQGQNRPPAGGRFNRNAPA